MHFASISFYCWFFVPLPILCSSSLLKKSLVLCSSSPPPVTSQETNLVARCRRVYDHAHDYHINSISNNRILDFGFQLESYRLGKKVSKAPKIQRLATPLTLQRKLTRIAEKNKRITKAKAEAAEY
ncbi:hypothetical protein E1A91_D05G347300v1 [Gossypium mustelinum]|uniref:Uncharacterized protein n=1 Tax=Gossypium mustelinum TaxID=34275 RepID=A0A5D2V4G5_GOSMU|nr:hypothetical protein E1A91_D05G347300v1 [Gossypium mustelinum]